MNSIKCKNCGLSNFSTETECRRCGYSFTKAASLKVGRSPSRFSISSLLMLALLAGVAYYVYTGMQTSVQQVNANEAKRAASQPAERPAAPGLSRSEYDKQKTQTYADAVRNSRSLTENNKHIQQTEQVLQQVSNGK